MKITDRIVSADDLIDAGACYGDDEVRRLVPSPVPLSATLDLDIPDDDKLWTSRLVQCPRERTWLAAQFARTALPYTDDVRVLSCIETCERYAEGGATYEELCAAADAARAAASEAADHAERRRKSAALAAAYAADAAEDAAYAVDAADHAARAAYAAATDATRAAAAYAARAACGAAYAARAACAADMLRIFKEALT